jgi:2-methylcitrate dehydratase PrpD
MEESKDSLAYRFARFEEKLNFDFVPREVVDATKSYILDWFGCAIGGSGVPSSQSILRVARELNGRSDSTVMGSGDKMEPTLAAMVNGTMSHALEMDDDHRTMCGHPGVAVIPAALAMSEKMGLNGKQFVEAVIVGYEMIIRSGTCFLGRAYYDGWHPTSTCGVFGAAASAAKAMALNSEQTATAFGLAGSMSGGTLEYHFKGSFAKRFHPGNAARNGILAAMMARDGFTGPWSIFEGEWGWLNTHCEKVAELDRNGKAMLKKVYDASCLCDALGERYDLLTNSFKVHSGGRFGATSIDACLEVVKTYNIQPEQVKEIRVGACDFTRRIHFTEGCHRPRNIVTAQFSLPFALAMILLHRKVSVSHFTEENMSDPEVVEMMDKVSNYVDAEAEAAYPKHYMATVTVVLKDGVERKATVEYPKGDPENRPTAEELHDKFRELAGMTLSPGRTERLLSALIDIEKIGRMSEIAALSVK